jgi:hypothetical protein
MLAVGYFGVMESLDRGSTKHAAWMDDAMAREVESVTDGSPAGSRVEEPRDPEPAGEDQPDALPVGRAGAPDGMTPEEVEQRSRLGRYIPLSVLPGRRDELIDGARTLNAPGDIIAQLSGLPADHPFETVSQIWAALGHPNESHRS